MESILEALVGCSAPTYIQCPDIVKQFGNTQNWHNAMGTGPFILTDFVDGTSATLVKNPNYWGYDERYPQNKLPYIDGVKYLIIPQDSTALAALRTGKIDIMGGISVQDATSLEKTNPTMLNITYPPYAGLTIDMKVDVAPFKDVRVREALQMAIDVPTIASTYYGGTVDPTPSSLTSNLLTGWGFPYAQWPQSLKDEYSYNPTTAKQLLTAAGYPNGFNTDVVSQSTADQELLQIVQSYFTAIGVNMSINTMDAASWLTFVQTNHKQDALAYKSIGTLSDDYSPMDQFGTFQTGGTFNIWNVSDPIIDAAVAKANAASSSLADIHQASKDVNQEVAEQHYSIFLVTPNYYVFYQPWLKGGFAGQYNSFPSGSSAPKLSAFYNARFWINQNLKANQMY